MRAQSFQIVEDGRALRIAWGAGGENRIAAALLRAECPSAQARRSRLDGRPINPASDLAIVGVSPWGATRSTSPSPTGTTAASTRGSCWRRWGGARPPTTSSSGSSGPPGRLLRPAPRPRVDETGQRS
jgi:uncharacterized protein DUF971